MEVDETTPENRIDKPKKLKKLGSINSIRIIKERETLDPITSERNNNHEYDILYENQRGLFLFGLPKFSSKALNQADPYAWTDKKQKYSPMDIYNFQLPDPTWEWVHKEWLIDMSGDVDEEGWEYAFNFHSSFWHGCYRPFRSFVRRRRWIRSRRKKGVKVSSAPTIPNGIHLNSDEKLDDFEELWHQVKASRLDREKLKCINDYIDNGGDINKFRDRFNDFVCIFDHQETTKKFLELILLHSDKVFLADSPHMLKFSSDVKELLNRVKLNINNEETSKKLSKGKEKQI